MKPHLRRKNLKFNLELQSKVPPVRIRAPGGFSVYSLPLSLSRQAADDCGL